MGMIEREGICRLDECGGQAKTRGLCNAHYIRWRKANPDKVRKPRPSDPLALVMSYVEVGAGGCWLWQLQVCRKGYARVQKPPGQKGVRLAHRWSYELLVGPIPEGLTLDHLCRIRHCVNPEHLEPVTLAENIRRSDGVTALLGRRTHCGHGHEFNAANTRVTSGYRQCRVCDRDRKRELRRLRSVA